ncbi:MAG: hypothetical protein ACI9YL_001880 [Luteibaculaceae bacterium]|jgi:hypothetical protein
MKLHLLTILFLCFGSLNSFCQDNEQMVSDRPGQTNSTFTLESGDAQIQVGKTHGLISYSNSIFHFSQESSKIQEAVIRFGLGKGFEINLGVAHLESEYTYIYNPGFTNPQASINSTEAFSDLSIGVRKSVVHQEKLVPNISVMAVLNRPTWISEFKPEDIKKHTIAALFSWDIAQGFMFSSNLILQKQDEEYDQYFTANLSWTKHKYTVFTEVFGPIINGGTQHGINAGAGFFVLPNLLLDLSFGNSVWWDDSQQFASIGASFKLPGKKKTSETPNKK